MGSVVGALWLTIFGVSIKTALLVGVVIGFLLGIALDVLGKTARLGGNINKNEATFVNSSILTMIAVFLVGAGIVAWIVKLILF